MKKLFLLSVMCLTALFVQAQTESQYVDLGLPSGTLWNSSNEKGGLYTYDEAIIKFGNKLPTQEQWEEIISFCTWTWIGNGYKITGKNKKNIVLYAMGGRNCEGYFKGMGTFGAYWSSSLYNIKKAWHFVFSKQTLTMDPEEKCPACSVRLVK